MATEPGTTRTAGSCWKLGERHGRDSPSGPPEGTYPSDTLILGFKPPELGEDTFVLFQATRFVVIAA